MLRAGWPPRIAVVGCGYWGTNLVRNFAELGALAAVSDASADRQLEFARKHGVPGLDLPAILADADIQGVVIAAPAARHAEMAIDALAAGKHVFVEKPLALELADAEQVLQKATKQGRIVMVGHLMQYHPAFQTLKQIVAKGDLGRIQYIYSNRLNLGKFRREENVFWSFAPHDISMILSLVGEQPEQVRTVSHCYLHPAIADVTTTHMIFPNGVNAHIFVSWLHPFKEQKLVIVGSEAMAVFNDGMSWAEKLVLYRHRIAWRNGMPEPEKGEATPVPVEAAEPLRLECQHFLECIADQTTPRTDAHEGIAVLRVLDAAQRSMVSGQPEVLQRSVAEAAGPTSYFAHETAVVDEGCEIGEGTRIWHFAHILRGTRIGSGCIIGQNVMIGPDVSIGSRCKIQNNVSLYRGVTLEDGVFCGPSCVFTNVLTPRAEIERKEEFLPTRVGRGATIGANATIVCGHNLGEYCFVAAGAVVTRDVPPFALVAGNPARQLGWVGYAGERLGPDLACPRTGRRYALGDRGLVEISEGNRDVA